MKKTVPVLCVLASIHVFSTARETIAGASFHGIGDLPGGSFMSQADAVSPDGSVVVGVSSSALSATSASVEAFRWSAAAGMQPLGDLSGERFISGGFGVSYGGHVIVGSSWGAEGQRPVRWVDGAGPVSLGTLGPRWPLEQPSGEASAVSSDGRVVVGWSTSPNGIEAFRWTEDAGMTGLGSLDTGNFGSTATGVSGDGSVIVGFSGKEAFRWTAAAGMVGLGALSGGEPGSAATAISTDGKVIVGTTASRSGVQGFRWTEQDGMISIGSFPHGMSPNSAEAVSANGSVIVGMMWGAGGNYAFIWDKQHGVRHLREVLVNQYGLDLDGWSLTSALGISDDGLTIVGFGRNPLGQEEGWIARLPEPATLALLAVGGCIGLRRRRRSMARAAGEAPRLG